MPKPGHGGSHRPGPQKPHDLRKTVGTLLGYVGRSKWLLIVVAVCVVLSSLCSIFGSYLLKPLINDCIVPGDYEKLARTLLLMAAIYVTGALLSFSYARIMVRVSQRTTHAIRQDLFSKMQDLPLSYFDTHTHGDLMSRYTNDIETITEILNNGLVNLVSNTVTFFGVVSVMLYLNPVLFLVTLFSLAMMFLVVLTIGKRSRLYFKAQQQSLGALNGYIEEMIEGQKVIKVFNHERTAREGFQERNETFRMNATNAQSLASSMGPISNNLSHVNYALTCCVGALVSIAMGMDLGSLVVYLNYVRQVSQPIGMMSQQVNSVLSAAAGAERVFEIMAMESELDDGKTVLVHVKREADGSLTEQSQRSDGWAWKSPDGKLTPLAGDVRFKDVVFRYVPEKRILHGISLYAKPGQKIAFVGSTGAGKTTITNLINRFYEIESGEITYDGINIQEISKESLRRSLGIVLQDTHLFTGTIADNIRYGKLDATDEEVRAAAKLANADTFIRHLPKGYDTWITDDGGNLSQGERQLLAIARAAVADPPVLILDEATSSIDTRTEKLIEQGMDSLMSNRTVFVIAHRLSTVRNAKAILVLEQGKIIERGDHNELLAQNGKYYQLYTGQMELT
ncbi:MAG: ABC transporter ATP-binding protein [Oscillospiraceae bacterium]|nr:ABC transporter ATP-binding protein [Oscillospiraceae bacterium]